MRLFFVICCAFLLVMPSTAQETTDEPPAPQINAPITAEFSVDNEIPLLGEPFSITLRIEADPTIEILTWVDFTDPIQVLAEGDIETTSDDGMTVHMRTYEVVLWQVGDYLSDDILITYQFGGAVSSVPVSSFYVQVPIQIINPEEATVRPSIAPIDLSYLSPWIFVGVAIGAVVVLMIVARLLQLSRRGVIQIIKASPAEYAIAELEDLKQQQLPASTVYEMVSNSLRTYLENRFEIQAVELTTGELIAVLREHNFFPKQHQQRLKSVLEQADLVKFAKFQPDNTSSLRLVNYCIKWLKETERIAPSQPKSDVVEPSIDR